MAVWGVLLRLLWAHPFEIAAVTGLGVVWLGCGYFAFWRRDTGLKDGQGKPLRKPYGKRVRQGAIAIFVASLVAVPVVWRLQVVMTAVPEDDRVLVLVAEFEDPQGTDSLGVTRDILQQLEEVTDDFGDEVVVEPLEVVPANVLRGSNWFRQQGEELGAEIVLWGDYVRDGNETRLRVNFEVLSAPERLELGESRQVMEFATVDSFDVTVLSSQTNYLTLLALGLAQYEAKDYEGAINRLMRATGETEDAVAALEKTEVQGAEEVVGFEVVFFFLGEAHRDAIEYEEAIAAYERAIDYKPEYPEALNNLGLTWIDWGRYQTAEMVLLEARETNVRLLGDRHPDVASSINNLALVYQAQGRYREAEPLCQQALEMRKELFGEQHLDVAASLNNLAALYRSQGRYEQAEPFYRQALEMRQELLGDKHPDVAASLNNLAGLYESQGRYEEAEPLYQQALALRQELLGDKHPSVAASFNNLAGLYLSQERYEEAEPLFLQTLELRKELLGDKHPAVADSINILGVVYRSQGRYEEAEPLFQQSLAIKREIFGDDNYRTYISIGSLGLLYELQNNPTDAEDYLTRALAGVEPTLGSHHHITNQYKEALDRIRGGTPVQSSSQEP